MNPIKHISGKPAAAIAVALLASAGLVACGSGDYHPPSAPAPTPTPTPVVDAFYTAVSALVANSPEDTEPGAIESTVATAPDDSQPQPLS